MRTLGLEEVVLGFKSSGLFQGLIGFREGRIVIRVRLLDEEGHVHVEGWLGGELRHSGVGELDDLAFELDAAPRSIGGFHAHVALFGHLLLEFHEVGHLAAVVGVLEPSFEVVIHALDFNDVMLGSLFQRDVHVLAVHIVSALGQHGGVQDSLRRNQSFALEVAIPLNHAPEEGFGPSQ